MTSLKAKRRADGAWIVVEEEDDVAPSSVGLYLAVCLVILLVIAPFAYFAWGLHRAEERKQIERQKIEREARLQQEHLRQSKGFQKLLRCSHAADYTYCITH